MPLADAAVMMPGVEGGRRKFPGAAHPAGAAQQLRIVNPVRNHDRLAVYCKTGPGTRVTRRHRSGRGQGGRGKRFSNARGYLGQPGGKGQGKALAHRSIVTSANLSPVLPNRA